MKRNEMPEPDIDTLTLSDDYQRVEQAIRFLQANFNRQPTLQEIASQVHLSEYHFQRLFTRWAGISPKRYLQYLTKEYARQILENTNLLDTAYAVGLSGTGRLHDLFITWEAVTPGEVRQRGRGLTLTYGFHPSLFGECLLAVTERGICHLSFIDPGAYDLCLFHLENRWREARLVRDDERIAPLVAEICKPYMGGNAKPLDLHVIGSRFQIKVWEALLHVGTGSLATYQGMANFIHAPQASRAVGRALAENPLALIIPCHRVIRSSGELGGYRWGLPRKQAILAKEFCMAAQVD